MKMQVFGSRDGKHFWHISGTHNDGTVKLYGSSDGGETFFPFTWTKDYKHIHIVGNARLGTLIEPPDELRGKPGKRK